MSYRFLLNITQPNNYSFVEETTGLFLNYENILSSVEHLGGGLKRAVKFGTIVDLDNAYPDVTDKFTDRQKADIECLIKTFDIKDDTKVLPAINAITNQYRDTMPPPIQNKDTADIPFGGRE